MFNSQTRDQSYKQYNQSCGIETNGKKTIFFDYNSQFGSLEAFKSSDASQKSIPIRTMSLHTSIRQSNSLENNFKSQNNEKAPMCGDPCESKSRGLMINPEENLLNCEEDDIAETNTINKIPVSPIGLKQLNSPLFKLNSEQKEFDSDGITEPSLISLTPDVFPVERTRIQIFDKKEPNRSFQSNFKPLLSNLTFHAPKMPMISPSNLDRKTLLTTPARNSHNPHSDLLSTQASNPKRKLRNSHTSTLTESDFDSSKKNQQQATSKFSLKYKDLHSSPEIDGRSTFHTNYNKDSEMSSSAKKKLNFPDDEFLNLRKPLRTAESLDFAKINRNENKFSITSEKLRDYLNEPKNWIKTLLTPNPRKGLKCECDIGLGIDKTCSRACRWLFKKYKANELSYLKETYEKIVQEQKIIEFEQTRQIDKDIHRTFPKCKLFEQGSEGIQILKRILNAIAKYDPSVGYVQGMNFIAGSLMFHAEEYVAFWVLVSLFEELEMRDIFLPKLPGLSKHCQITDILILNYKPNIYTKLCEFQIRPELFLTEWVLTLFGNIAPISEMGEIYDNLFMQGWVFFYKLVLAFLGHFEKEIEQESDMIGVLTILKSQNRLANKPDNYKSVYKFEWRDLCKKANEIDIDPTFIYEMHLKFDIKNQWFRTSS